MVFLGSLYWAVSRVPGSHGFDSAHHDRCVGRLGCFLVAAIGLRQEFSAVMDSTPLTMTGSLLGCGFFGSLYRAVSRVPGGHGFDSAHHDRFAIWLWVFGSLYWAVSRVLSGHGFDSAHHDSLWSASAASIGFSLIFYFRMIKEIATFAADFKFCPFIEIVGYGSTRNN